jgi:hypothetical protein
MTLTGHCLCGACRFAFDGPPKWTGHCHCESCRRATASMMTTFAGVADGAWRWTGATPATYHSSPGVTRHFCPTCGSQLAFRSARWPGETHFHAALLDDTAQIEIEGNFHTEERLSWPLDPDQP